MKKFGYLLLFALIMIFYGNAPAFADAAVPLWIYSSHTFFATSILDGWEYTFVWGLIILSCVILIEVLVFNFLDKVKKITTKEKITSVISANILSTIIGTAITIPLLLCFDRNGWDYFVFGPILLVIIPFHIFCFILSYFVEFVTYKRLLGGRLELVFIKKVSLWTNIWTYFIINIFPLVLFFMLFLSLDGYVQHFSKATYNSNSPINVSQLKEPIEINNVKIISPSFVPERVTYFDCKKFQKQGYKINTCKYNGAIFGFWFYADAVRQCEDINGRLPNNKEWAHIAEYLYDQQIGTFSNLDKRYLSQDYTFRSSKAKVDYLKLEYNSSKAEKINMPKLYTNSDYFVGLSSELRDEQYINYREFDYKATYLEKSVDTEYNICAICVSK